MAWAEKTFFNVDNVPDAGEPDNEDSINQMLKNLPPFMKMTSRRARKILVRYEALKERQIENLRNNHVFKFVMKVAGFTNDRVEKFWKGSDISPFMEKYKPKNIKITKEDLSILIIRAREHALSDLHQFCTEIAAIPMYRPGMDGEGTQDRDPHVNIPDHSALPDPGSGDGTGKYASGRAIIYNMSDSEFYVFCKKFLLMKKTLAKAYDTRNEIGWYLLTDGLDNPNVIPGVYDHTKYFNVQEEQVSAYGLGHLENKKLNKDGDASTNNFWTWMDNTPIVHWDKTTADFWFQRYIAKWLADDHQPRGTGDQFKDLEPFRVRFRSLFNNLRLDKTTGKWIRDLTGLRLTKMIRGRTKYKDRAIGFKSLEAIGEEQPDGTVKIAPLTRTASQQAKGSKVPVGVTKFEKAEEEEGDKDMERPEDMPTEVPLDFVRPIFNDRFAHWKHELVLGEYEKRSMQEADKWLQMTPWAIGKIYLQPCIYAHMQEAHIAITRKFKKFAHLSLEDWLNSDEHSYFFSKLVALCIKTSEVLSGKKYGLDKMYMRINLEKRRIMYALGKLESPTRQRRAPINTVRPSASRQRTLRDWSDARMRGDTALAASIQVRLQRTPF